MRRDGDFIALDWGTSNRRAFHLDAGGRILAAVRDGAGVLAVVTGGFEREIAALRDRFGTDRVIAAGMVGSTRGWVEAPYVPAPAGLDDLARALVTPAPGIAIVPGVSLVRDDRYDVMRGEEVQVLGAVAAGLVPADAWLCQPGTHNKWIRVEGARIVDVATAMTGELFALLKAGGILAGMLDGEVAAGATFDEGLDRGAQGDLSTALFGVRARVLLGALAPGDAAAYASGVLIGADVAAGPARDGAVIHVVGTGTLAPLYARAIERRGGRPVAIDAEAAFVAGMTALRDRAA